MYILTPIVEQQIGMKMGTDIHAVFQVKKDGEWVDIPSEFQEHRNYGLFGWLADVRNGRGFAGVLLGQPVVPLQKARGLPCDFTMRAHPNEKDYGGGNEYHRVPREVFDASWRAKYADGTDEDLFVWMGYHDHGWLSFDEILAAPASKAWKTGVIDIASFNEWDGQSPPPNGWSGSIGGRNVRVAENPCLVSEDTTHVQVFWVQDDLFGDFVTEIARLKAAGISMGATDGRMVFGFDS